MPKKVTVIDAPKIVMEHISYLLDGICNSSFNLLRKEGDSYGYWYAPEFAEYKLDCLISFRKRLGDLLSDEAKNQIDFLISDAQSFLEWRKERIAQYEKDGKILLGVKG